MTKDMDAETLAALKELLEMVEAGQRVTYEQTDPVIARLVPDATLGVAGDFHAACSQDGLDTLHKVFCKVLPMWTYTIEMGIEVTKVSAFECVLNRRYELSGAHVSAVCFDENPSHPWRCVMLKALIAEAEQ